MEEGLMAHIRVNGVSIAYEVAGEGEPLVLVHGSWGDRHNWDTVFDSLARSFRVIRYDRRGHSESERPAGQGSFQEDADDLSALIEALRLGKVHVVGNSGGAAIALKLSAKRPELFRSLIVHEPPSFHVLADIPELAPVLEMVGERIHKVIALLSASRIEEGAQTFVEEIAFGPGAWPGLPEQLRRTFIFNAPTWLDETRDPDALDLDLAALARFDRPALVSDGSTSPPFFAAVVRKVAAALPHATHATFSGAGHVPHLSHPAEYVHRVQEFARSVSRA
jgi:pimeloyl-ACP methyl ester carboxylesterase